MKRCIKFKRNRVPAPELLRLHHCNIWP